MGQLKVGTFWLASEQLIWQATSMESNFSPVKLLKTLSTRVKWSLLCGMRVVMLITTISSTLLSLTFPSHNIYCNEQSDLFSGLSLECFC